MSKEREALQKIATMLKGSRIADIATEALQSESEWISVEDRLPEYGMRVLCYCQEQNDLGLSHFVWNCSYNETDRSFTDLGKRYSVTHWMPLPQAPKTPKI